MVNWNADDVREFKEEARLTQQTFCNLLGGRWHVIERKAWNTLRRKVGFAIFGPPRRTPKENNSYTGYSEKKMTEVIEPVCDMIVEGLHFRKKDIDFACIFLAVKVHDERYTVPVFRVRSDDDDDTLRYVDITPRRYSNFRDFLENNKLEKCIYCYPYRGRYKADRDTGKVLVEFGTSPACDFTSRLARGADALFSIASIVVTTGGLLALFSNPVSGGLLSTLLLYGGTATSVYSASRSAYALYDRAAHGQSIELSDAEARGHWVTVVGSVLGIGLDVTQRRMISNMTDAARAGRVMSRAGRIAVNVISSARVTVKAVVIIQGFAVLLDKYERDDLSALDVYMYTASVLFFVNHVIEFKTANSIIRGIHRGEYGDLQELIEETRV